jgi:hypothetical protein
MNPFKQLRRLLKPYFTCSEIPDGVMNGVNKEFILSNIPRPSSTLQLYVNGLRLTEGKNNDYTLVNDTIKFNIPPETGSIIVADYFIFE